MPDERDDHQVPPLKVMRKRLNGVYRADSGFSGPTRRYVLIVALLVGLASVPTLAAITAGSNELTDGKTDTMDVPFLPPASPGPIRTRPPIGSATVDPSTAPSAPPSSPSSSAPPLVTADPGTTGEPESPAPGLGASPGAQAAIRAGRILGQIGRRQAQPKPSAPVRDEYSHASAPSGGYTASSGRAGIEHPGSEHPGSRQPGTGHSGSGPPAKRPSASRDPGSRPATGSTGPAATGAGSSSSLTGFLADDDTGFPSIPGFPELPAFSAPDPSDDSPPKGLPPSSNAGHDYGKPARPNKPTKPTKPIKPTKPADPDEPSAWADRPVCHERGKCGTRPSDHHRPDLSGHRQCDNATHQAARSDHRTIHIDRSIDRSAHRRRSAVTERPQNVRPARTLERPGNSGSGHHARRSIPEARNPEARGEDNQIANRSYHGSHRAAGQHHADQQTPAQQRNSRVGRHHADPHDDYINRW